MQHTRSWPGAVVAFAAVVVVLLLNQVTLGAVLAYTAYLALVVVLPGTIVWSWVMERVESATGRDAADRSRLEDLVCGTCAGYALELPAYAVARWLDVPRAYVVVQAAIVVAYLARGKPWRRHRNRERARWGTAPALGLGAVVAYSAAWLGARVMSAFPLRPVGVFADSDDPFQLALIGEMRHHFPGVYPYVPDEALTYQYFFHLHAAASTWVTGLSPLEVFARFDPMVFTALAVAGAACVAHRLTGRPWAGVVAAAILTLVGAFDVSGLFQGQANVEDRFLSALLVHASNQAMAFALVTPLVVLALEVVRVGGRLGRTGWAAFLVFAVVMTGVKVTFVPMLLAGLAATAALQVIRQRRRRAATTAAASAVCLLAILVCLVFIYRGQSRDLELAPLSVAAHYAGFFQLQAASWLERGYVLACVFVGVLVPSAGVVGLLTRKMRRDERVWLLLFTALSGLAACALLGHSGLSQRYFLYSAAWFLAVASAWGLSAVFPAGEPRSTYVKAVCVAVAAGLALFGVRLLAEPHSVIRPLESGLELKSGIPGSLNPPVIGALVLAFLAVAVVRRPDGQRLPFQRTLVVSLVGLGLARAVALLVGHLPVEEPRQFPDVSAGGIDATDWLRQNTSPDERVMTNAHCIPLPSATSGERCDNRHFWMSALSERRFLLEGWGYVGTAVWKPYAGYAGDTALLADNDRLFTDPSAEGVKKFVVEHDVRWMLVDLARPADVAELQSTPGVTTAYANREFVVLELRP